MQYNFLVLPHLDNIDGSRADLPRNFTPVAPQIDRRDDKDKPSVSIFYLRFATPFMRLLPCRHSFFSFVFSISSSREFFGILVSC